MSDQRDQLRRAFADAIRQTSGGHRNYLYDHEAGDYADAVLGLGEVVEQSEVAADLDGTYDADGRLIHNGCGREILYFDEGAICECGGRTTGADLARAANSQRIPWRCVVIRQWAAQVAVALVTAALAALIGVVVDALVAVVRRGGLSDLDSRS